VEKKVFFGERKEERERGDRIGSSMISLRSALGTCVAATTAVGAVAAGAQAVDASSPPPKFSMTESRFDLSTRQGRFAQQLSNCDPSTLLVTETEIQGAQKMLAEWRQGRASDRSEKELWQARKLVESAVHPDTKEIIPRPFRMSGYVPFNGPVCVAMMASQSTPTLLFWNWINQSQNALVNYFNRNASSSTSNETLGLSYLGAVGSALVVAFGLSQFIKRRFSPVQASKLMRFVAFPSSIVASCSNCYIMRRPEIDTGVEITSEDGEVLAGGTKSSAAAEKAVMETVMSRAILQVPVFFIPAAIMSLPPLVALTAASPSLAIPLSTMFTMISFGFGLPGAVSYFPQYGTLPVESLEQEIKEALGSFQEDVVFYNKGL